MRFEIIDTLQETKEAKVLQEIKREDHEDDYYDQLYEALCNLYETYILSGGESSSMDEQKGHVNILTNANDNFSMLGRAISSSSHHKKFQETVKKINQKLIEIRNAIKEINPEPVEPVKPVISSQETDFIDHSESAYRTLLQGFTTFIKGRNCDAASDDYHAISYIDNRMQHTFPGVGGGKTILDPENKQVIDLYRAALNKPSIGAAFRIIEACIDWHMLVKKESKDVFLNQLLQKFVAIKNRKNQNLDQVCTHIEKFRKESDLFFKNINMMLSSTVEIINYDISILRERSVSSPTSISSKVPTTRGRRMTDMFGSFWRKKSEEKQSPPSTSVSRFWKRSLTERLRITNERYAGFSAYIEKIKGLKQEDLSDHSAIELKAIYAELVRINGKCMEKIKKYSDPANAMEYPKAKYAEIISKYGAMSKEVEILMDAISIAQGRLKEELPPALTNSYSELR